VTTGDPKDEQTNVSEEEEVMSEVAERAMEINMKLLTDNNISHAKRMDIIAEEAIQYAVNQQNRLAEVNINHIDNMNNQVVENNRYTLDRLYSVYPEEAAGLATILKALLSSGIITVKPPEQ